MRGVVKGRMSRGKEVLSGGGGLGRKRCCQGEGV